jgi:4-hydroxybenzoate polyprenyltransferase/phosphoserine phosphatase
VSRPARKPAKSVEPPLIVDVDGTLVRTDLLQEAALQFVARFPLEVWRLLLWLLKGKAVLKAELAQRVNPGISSVPLRAETVDMIRQAQAEGRSVYLASASDHRYVQELADRIGGIAGVFATDPQTNLAGGAKAQRLEAEFGAGGFDYVGDQPVDFPVWRSARKQIAVSHTNAFTRRLRAAFPDIQVIAEPRAPARAYLKALRPHQWAKNALVFLPTIAGHQFTVTALVGSFVAFTCFSLAASSAYLINDLLDLPGDRDHATKHRRPFAAGIIPIPAGILLSIVLMATSAALSLLLPLDFSFVLLAYVALTLSYSFYLKRKLIVDVITLGGLYTIRVLGGIRAGDQPPSPWLLTFCLFLFLSLATVKRCSEMIARREAGKGAALGRGYRPGDLDALMPLAAAAGYGAVLVVTLYLASPEVARLYSHPFRMWLICPALLYWISRVLVLSSRDEMHDDPVVFALTDRVSWLTGAYAAAIIAVSL